MCITFGQPIIPLPRAPNFSDRVADKSRFHTIYIDDDIIPRMMRYLDPVSTKLKNQTCGLPEKFKSQQSPEKVRGIYSIELICMVVTIVVEFVPVLCSGQSVLSCDT